MDLDEQKDRALVILQDQCRKWQKQIKNSTNTTLLCEVYYWLNSSQWLDLIWLTIKLLFQFSDVLLNFLIKRHQNQTGIQLIKIVTNSATWIDLSAYSFQPTKFNLFLNSSCSLLQLWQACNAVLQIWYVAQHRKLWLLF